MLDSSCISDSQIENSQTIRKIVSPVQSVKNSVNLKSPETSLKRTFESQTSTPQDIYSGVIGNKQTTEFPKANSQKKESPVVTPKSNQNSNKLLKNNTSNIESKKISNDQELIQSDPTSCPQNQKGNN